MNHQTEQLATEINRALQTLNQKFQEAENNGLYIIAKINEFQSLDDSKADKCSRIEAAVLQPILPTIERE